MAGRLDEFFPECYVTEDGTTLRCRGLETGAEGALTPKGYVHELSPVGKARIKSFVHHLRVAADCLLPPVGTTFRGALADESFAIVGFDAMRGVPHSVELLLKRGTETNTFRQDLISKLIGKGSDLIKWNGGLKVSVAPRQPRFQHQTGTAAPLQPDAGGSPLSQAPALGEQTELDCSAKMVGRADAAVQEDDGSLDVAPSDCQIAQGPEMVVWKTYMTPEGIPYYHCDALKTTVWNAPDGAVVMPPEEKPDVVTWHEHTTADGLVYYHNPASEQSVWNKPEGVGVQVVTSSEDTAADDRVTQNDRATQMDVVVSIESRFAVRYRDMDSLITPLKVGWDGVLER